MKVWRRTEDTPTLFIRRTVAAQLHALGAILMLVDALILLPYARRAGIQHQWACSAYLFSGGLVFLISSTYHFLHDGFQISPRLADMLENLDHFGIYLFIAGTYSPFLLNAIAPPYRAPAIILIWSLAILGILYTATKHRLPIWMQGRVVGTGLFLAMGWLIVLRAGELYASSSALCLAFFIGGCLSYSAGAVVYGTKRPRLLEGFFGYHELWHLLVILGAQFHFLCILSFYARF